MRKKQNVLIVFLIGTAIFCQGCVVAAVGLGAAGTVAYISGDLESTETKNIEVVYSAALQAVEQLELRIVSKSKDALSATIIAYDAEEKKIQIKMSAPSEHSTKLSIRVGTFGNETKSNRIYQRMYNNMNPVER
ncbi:MAG: DUF3568 family protein [Sedimentisphaerales bacterium]|nr:DUF3568 family protein [Sedimentisphaerales bacterium]